MRALTLTTETIRMIRKLDTDCELFIEDSSLTRKHGAAIIKVEEQYVLVVQEYAAGYIAWANDSIRAHKAGEPNPFQNFKNYIGESKMNELQIFNYENNEIRTVQKDGATWWVLKDVCTVLGLSNPTIVSDRLDSDEVTKFNLGGLSGESNIVNESGLYNVIIRSDKPEAKAFKRWVTHDVLPAIRQTGAYMTPETIEQVLLDPDTIISLATQLKALQAQNVKQTQLIGELKPKADYTDRILRSKSLLTVTQIAKDYGMSGNAMNKLLHRMGVQYKVANQWVLYAKHQAKGYTHSETIDIVRTDGREDVSMNTKWSQKGRLFLYNLLKSEGILPLVEQPNVKLPQ